MSTNPSGYALVHLYRNIMKLHKSQLPPPMRELGDKYVKSEFKAHWTAKTTDSQWIQFHTEWDRYYAMLKGQGDLADQSGDLAPDLIDDMSHEQKLKLAELRQQAKQYGEEVLQDK
eukprot:TRINITY_DN3483_c1_g1_i10.p3 TRINITY_DN3483_c1_g1~~TRINITY_DN3483_c1_g1_i10.p3  ORF type:complete len:116 (-),score=9.50 TRINITY_DN3483_c1_g1_i10:433-780(-)